MQGRRGGGGGGGGGVGELGRYKGRLRNAGREGGGVRMKQWGGGGWGISLGFHFHVGISCQDYTFVLGFHCQAWIHSALLSCVVLQSVYPISCPG